MDETRKHPLWQNVLLLLEDQGVNYKTIIPTEWLEKELELKRDERDFDFAVSYIRQALEHRGLY